MTGDAYAQQELQAARAAWNDHPAERRAHLRRAAQAMREAGLPVRIGADAATMEPASCPDCDAPILWRVSARATGTKRIAMAIDAAPSGGDLYVTDTAYRLIPTVEWEMMHASTRATLHRFHRATCLALHPPTDSERNVTP